MNIRNIAAVAAFGLAVALPALAGGPSDYMNYKNPPKYHGYTWCHVTVSRVYQPNEHQPLHVVMSNAGKTRIGFDMKVTLRDGRNTETGNIHVDNFNSTDDHQDRPTDKGFNGTANGTVTLEITNCEKKG